jgi:iron(III) transport system substrate-binding protein
MAKHGFSMPGSWEDLTKPEYAGHVAMPNPNSSGTGCLDVSSWLQRDVIVNDLVSSLL